jgi:hypothetical protein
MVESRFSGDDRGINWCFSVTPCIMVYTDGGTMSTIWYGLREPVTSIRVDPRPDRKMYDVIIWLNNQQSGRVIVKASELKEFIGLFLNKYRGIIYQQDLPGGGKDSSWIGPEDYQGQVISEDYMQTVVHRDDYNVERATHLWLGSGRERPSDDKPVGR